MLQEKVDNEEITQKQMDQRLANAEERITAILNGERHSRMHRDKEGTEGRFQGRSRLDKGAFDSGSGEFHGRSRGRSEDFSTEVRPLKRKLLIS